MVAAIYCDKCGKIHTGEESKNVNFKGMYSTDEEFNMDLCPVCTDDLEKWINTKRKVS